MKTIIYIGGLGPDIINCGEAGQFIKGEPKKIDDDTLADQLLAKGSFISDPPTDRHALVADLEAALEIKQAEAEPDQPVPEPESAPQAHEFNHEEE